MAGGQAAPGKVQPAGQAVNFPAGQAVVQSHVTERVQRAKQDTCANVKADPFHTRRPQDFSLEVRVTDWKVGRHVSHEKLWSEISPSRFRPGARHLRSNYEFDKQRDHSFSRAQEPGWNASTAHQGERARTRQTMRDTRRATSVTRQSQPSDYIPPIARTQSILEAQRAEKRATREAAQQLETRWGPECAAAMQHIAALRQQRDSHQPRRLKVNKADRAAVDALPQSDSEPETPLPVATAGSQLAVAMSMSFA